MLQGITTIYLMTCRFLTGSPRQSAVGSYWLVVSNALSYISIVVLKNNWRSKHGYRSSRSKVGNGQLQCSWNLLVSALLELRFLIPFQYSTEWVGTGCCDTHEGQQYSWRYLYKWPEQVAHVVNPRMVLFLVSPIVVFSNYINPYREIHGTVFSSNS